MEKLYIETKKSLLRVNELLGQFENVYKDDSAESAIKNKIDDLFREIKTSFDQLDIYVTKEPAIRKYDSKLKVDQVKYDFQHYNTAYNSIKYRKDQRMLQERQREELLRATMPSSTPGQVQINLGNEQADLRHFKRLNHTNNELDRMIAHGEDTLSNLKEQNSALKTIKTKMLNVSNALGLSTSLIRLIERRNQSDKYVLYGGMVVTLVIMFFAVRYLL